MKKRSPEPAYHVHLQSNEEFARPRPVDEMP
jgi:hypothetical protein